METTTEIAKELKELSKILREKYPERTWNKRVGGTVRNSENVKAFRSRERRLNHFFNRVELPPAFILDSETLYKIESVAAQYSKVRKTYDKKVFDVLHSVSDFDNPENLRFAKTEWKRILAYQRSLRDCGTIRTQALIEFEKFFRHYAWIIGADEERHNLSKVIAKRDNLTPAQLRISQMARIEGYYYTDLMRNNADPQSIIELLVTEMASHTLEAKPLSFAHRAIAKALILKSVNNPNPSALDIDQIYFNLDRAELVARSIQWNSIEAGILGDRAVVEWLWVSKKAGRKLSEKALLLANGAADIPMIIGRSSSKLNITDVLIENGLQISRRTIVESIRLAEKLRCQFEFELAGKLIGKIASLSKNWLQFGESKLKKILQDEQQLILDKATNDLVGDKNRLIYLT